MLPKIYSNCKIFVSIQGRRKLFYGGGGGGGGRVSKNVGLATMVGRR